MKEIQLSEFVSTTLIQIAQGVKSANKELRDPNKHQFDVFSLRVNKGDYSKIPGIQFDVAVTASKQQRDKAGFIVALANIGGEAKNRKSAGAGSATSYQI